MLFRILKNDLKRKKTMNIILFLFIIMATMFVASGLNNVITVMNGTDYYLDKAGIGDYVILTMGENSVGALDEMLRTENAVKDYRKEEVVFGSQDTVKAQDGSLLESKNMTIFQSAESLAITLFDEHNEIFKGVEPGHICVAGSFMENNGLKKGDIICFEHSGVKLSLVLDGMVKDALLGSDMMGNTRFILSDEDMQKILENREIHEHYRGEICYIDTEDVQSINTAISKLSNVAFDGERSVIKMCYVMDMIVAFLMMVLSICLIIVSFVVLKFSITFTIMEEFREIGVMKAIGISNGKIRSLYVVKYLGMAFAGAAIGFFASIPFGRLLLDSVSKEMVLGNDNMLLVNFLGAVFVVIIIVLFAYLFTGRVKKASPVDAIRKGQTGERYKSKCVLSLRKSPFKNEFFMALNDILSNIRRFITIILSFGLCTLFVLMLVNTTSTLKSPNLIDTFGTKSHLYMTDVEESMKYMSGSSEEAMQEKLNSMEKELTSQGMPAELSIEIQYKYPVTFNGNEFKLTCQQGMNVKSSEYAYTEGTPPQSADEIAITPQISELTGAKIGDVLTIHFGGRDMDCIITAYFQTMNQLGSVIRLHDEAPTDFSFISSTMSFQIDFTDNPSDEEIESRKERIKKLYNNDKVMNSTEYCIDCMQVADTMESVQFLLLGITIVVVILVTILMERSFIADETSQIAILKAIGFKDGAVIKWHIYRFGLAALIAVILAAVLSIPMTNICITPIFGMMGAADVRYNIEPLKIFLIYPGAVFIMTIVIAWITAMYTKTVKSSDTANIE